jgi:hypothetical protein
MIAAILVVYLIGFVGFVVVGLIAYEDSKDRMFSQATNKKDREAARFYLLNSYKWPIAATLAIKKTLKELKNDLKNP